MAQLRSGLLGRMAMKCGKGASSRQQRARDQPAALVIGLGIGIVALALAAGAIWAWVAHNQSLARRREAQRGGRRGAPDAPINIPADARGRAVRITPGARDARIVVVRVEKEEKVLAPEHAP